MSDWLEAEERKLEAKRQELLLLSEREEVVHKHLKTFYDLCERVNGVRPDSLSINRLKIEGRRTHTIRETESDGDGGRMGVGGKRAIRISCPNKDETFIDVVINEHHYHIDRELGDISSDRDKVIIRNTCTLQELINWREDQIIRFIQWMLLESEVTKDTLPGREIFNELAVAEAKRAEAKKAQDAYLAEASRRAMKAKEKARRKNIIGGTLAGISYGSGVGMVVGFFRSCSVQHFSVDSNTFGFTWLLCAGIGAVIGLAVGYALGSKE